MKITFIGATHDVTGSCTLLEAGGHTVLIDCGMRQGTTAFENVPLPVAEKDVECVLLTHAHVDHSGLLPLLYKNGFRGAVYTTEATRNLCEIMLRDCANIQMSEAEYQSRKARRAGEPEVPPLFDLNDAEGVLKLFRGCEYERPIQINEALTVRFTDIGHLLGSACVEAWLHEGDEVRKMVFSGDVGNTGQPIIRDPQRVAEADYVMLESTYGDRFHGERREYINTLAGFLQKTLDRGGNPGDFIFHPRDQKRRPGHGAPEFSRLCGQSAGQRGHLGLYAVRHGVSGRGDKGRHGRRGESAGVPRPAAHHLHGRVQGAEYGRGAKSHPLRLRHVRRWPRAPSSEVQPLAA